MNTGIQEIDNIIGELKTSELLVIGGDYSIGKTSLLVSLLKTSLLRMKSLLLFLIIVIQIKH